jgi:hypothetical protein
MQNYKKANLIGGWIAFSAAAIVYILTIEPTTSFWDCGEFITSAWKLQVGHPPGAPFFMLLGRFFTIFAGDVSGVAVSINIMSALASAFTILFLFWSITHLAARIVVRDNTYSLSDIIIITGAGFTGALAYAFSDTFWFSAVEAEVYALSSLFTAVVFWAILKWESVAGQPFSNRWLVLIAYLMGLSIGVHLLNLLAIPAIVFIFYFKNYKVTSKGFIAAALLSVGILIVMMYGIIQGFVVLASWFELFFVNTLGMPFKSGVVFYLLLVTGLLVFGLVYTRKRNKPVFHTIILCITVIMIGYSSFSLIVIRSNANPPMDQNSPDNIFSLLYYLNREQYGDRPLLYGQYYNAPVNEETGSRPAYIQKDGKYVAARQSFKYTYDSRFKTIFPRMYASGPDYIEAYKEWGKIRGRNIRITNAEGEPETLIKPTFTENLRFFFNYQLGHMYGRYFMWNFAGRQNDIQGHGRILEGNWISGINSFDSMRLGPQYGLPDHLENNKARNKYYLLPLIVGLVGLLYQYQKSKKDSWVVFLLFFFTGIAIVIYLNQTPFQPRERDYAFAGSFYAFSIWIGLGVLAVYDNIRKYLKGITGAIFTVVLTLLFVPGLMALQNWDDHDRSERYTARDFAWNYLNSCAPNAILFTYGDNDTFPLWFLQEVEGVRTDVRVVNLSYLSADWYIGQMKRKVYESEPLPLTMEKDQYVQGTRDIIYIVDRSDRTLDLRAAVDFVLSDDIRTKVQVTSGEHVDYLPGRRFSLPADSLQILNTGTLAPGMARLALREIEWEINRNYLTKSGLAVLDILAANNWERPVYFAITVPSSEYLGLDDYFQNEGMAYRLVPIRKTRQDGFTGHIDTDIMYRNMMEIFKWGNINDPGVYLDETNLRMVSNMRSSFARLSGSLLDEGKRESAILVLDKAMELMPHESVPYNYFIVPIVTSYYLAGEKAKATALAKEKAGLLKKELNYYVALDSNKRDYVEFEMQRALRVFHELIKAVSGNDDELEMELNSELSSYYHFLMEEGYE